MTARRLPLISSYASMISLAVMVNSPPVCLTALASAFGLNQARMGMVPGTVFAGVVLGICVSGVLSDRFGMKPFLLTGLACQVVGLVGVVLAPRFNALLAAAFIGGVGGGVMDALLSPLVCVLRPNEKTRAMNLLHAFYCIGAVITVGAAMALLKWGVNWRWIFGLGIVPSTAAFVGLSLSRIPPPPGGEAGRVPLRLLLRSPRFCLLAGAMLLCGGTELGPAQWFPAYVERALGWQREASAVGLLLFSVAMAAGRLGATRVARHVSPRRMICVSAVSCAVLILVMSQPWSNRLSLCSGVLLGVAVAALWPTTLAYTAHRFPAGGAAMFSLLAAAGNAGGAVFPWAIGVIAQHSNIHWGLGAAAVLPAVLAVVFLFMQAETKTDV